MDHLDFQPDFDGHTLEVADAHGVLMGHVSSATDGLTFENVSGAHIGYAYDFGGLDYILDKQHELLGSVDSLGNIHAADGELLGHYYDNHFGPGPEILDNENRVIATVIGRMGV